MPSLPVLYFITPTVESVNRMLHDYRDKKSPKYGKAHLYFTSHLSDALLLKIKASPLIKTVASFKELNLEFLAAEGNAFTLDSPQSLPLLYAEDSSPDATRAKEQEHHRIANMLVTVCATLGELPHVRFDGTRTDAGTPREAAASVARILQDKLEALRANPTSGFPSRHLGDDERPTLLLLERSFDVVSPLLHEYTYQAMVHDLLPVHDDRYTYRYVGNNSQTISKEVLLNDSDPSHSLYNSSPHSHLHSYSQVLLNDSDPLWMKFRHMHIAELLTTIHAEYKEFLEKHKESAALGKQGGAGRQDDGGGAARDAQVPGADRPVLAPHPRRR